MIEEVKLSPYSLPSDAYDKYFTKPDLTVKDEGLREEILTAVKHSYESAGYGYILNEGKLATKILSKVEAHYQFKPDEGASINSPEARPDLKDEGLREEIVREYLIFVNSSGKSPEKLAKQILIKVASHYQAKLLEAEKHGYSQGVKDKFKLEDALSKKIEELQAKYQNYVELDPNQELPENPHKDPVDYLDVGMQDGLYRKRYLEAQQDMLKNGFRRVKEKDNAK